MRGRDDGVTRGRMGGGKRHTESPGRRVYMRFCIAGAVCVIRVLVIGEVSWGVRRSRCYRRCRRVCPWEWIWMWMWRGKWRGKGDTRTSLLASITVLR